MSLTIREKEHWKERIEKRIRTEIEEIKATDREFFALVKNEAEKLATVETGIEEEFEKRRELEDKKRDLTEEIETLESDMVAKLRKAVPDMSRHYYNDGTLINDALSKFIPQLEKSLIANHKVGQRVLELEREKETLLDTVWLATSSPQIRELWQQVDALLNVKSSALQTTLLKSNTPE